MSTNGSPGGTEERLSSDVELAEEATEDATGQAAATGTAQPQQAPIPLRSPARVGIMIHESFLFFLLVLFFSLFKIHLAKPGKCPRLMIRFRFIDEKGTETSGRSAKWTRSLRF